MKKNLFSVLFVTLFFSLSHSAEFYHSASERPTYGKQDKIIHETILAGIEEFYKGNFQSALNFFKKIEKYPKFRYVADYYHAVTLGKIMYYYHTNEFDKEFDRLLNASLTGAEKDTGTEDAKIRSSFYKGGAKGYLGLRFSEKGEWVRAYFNATASVDIYNALLQLKPNIRDSYLALGQYRYYKSLKRSEYWFLAFMGDETDQALSEIDITARHGIYANLESITALLHIYIESNKINKAEEQLNKLLPKYSNNIFFKEQKGKIHFMKKEWADAITSFQNVLTHNQNDSFKNNQYLYAQYFLSMAYFYSGDQEKANEFLQKLITDTRLIKDNFLKPLRLKVNNFAEYMKQNRVTIIKTRDT